MSDIFEKFTTNYKMSVIAAIDLADKLHHGTVEPIHLLYGLSIQKGSVSYELLRNAKITPERIATYLATFIGRSSPNRQKARLSETSQNCLIKSVIIAAEKNHRYIGTEHLLFAIMLIEKKFLTVLFAKLQGDFGKVERQLAAVLKGVNKFSELTTNFESGGMFDEFFEKNPAGNYEKLSTLEAFATELTSHEIQNKLDPVIGREKEIERIIHILSRRTKNNPLLLGDPGVGKTAIIEGLAKKIHLGDVPDTLLHKKIWNIDLAAMIAGTMYRGEFEARLKQLLEEVKDDPNSIIFIDEVHNVIGSGSASGSLDTANILKPSLARGEIKLIGATTYAEYKKHIQNDPAFERRLQPVAVKEPSTEKTREILFGIKHYYENFHKVRILDNALSAAIELTDRYIKDKRQPDKAIDVIDEASAKLKVAQVHNTENEKIQELEQEILRVKKQKHTAVIQEDFNIAFEMRATETKLEKKLFALRKKKEAIDAEIKGSISREDIVETIARITGIPLEKLNTSEKERLMNLQQTLGKNIKGQDKALAILSAFVKRARLGFHDPKRPMGCFMFVGPSGVGKTETAKTLANALFDEKGAFIRVDMSEFSDKINLSKLIGSPAGYVGYKETETLTDKVRKNPHSIVLFDEIEKAHPEVYSLLLQILEDGHLTDAVGTQVDFKNTIIILTTNVGSHLFIKEGSSIGFLKNSTTENNKDTQKLLNKELEKRFRPEFLNRLDQIISFQPLQKDDLIAITRNLLNELNQRLEQMGISVTSTEKALEILALKNYKAQFGARSIRRNIQELIETPIANMMLTDELAHGDSVTLVVHNKHLKVQKKQVTILTKETKLEHV